MENIIRSKPPRFSGVILAAEMLRRAGYEVDAASDRGHPLLVVYDPVYQVFPQTKELVFSHLATVHLRGSATQTILAQAAKFIDDRS